ncbi:Aconitase [Colletotrichum higginsianum IMI 349063]|uniref:Aconitase n=2 Tax=Colletotrichum higginsianum TaxID=80884 RepID=A0A1B7Y7F9_COLHI|nr:Aconitase [Colletotrichum higginsianum IMI 349063]OBR08003.1 Aconitase [Colletotrichum higginsianum IMI 349063]
MAVESSPSRFMTNVLSALKRIRGVDLDDARQSYRDGPGLDSSFTNLGQFFHFVDKELRSRDHVAEAEAIAHVAELCATDPELGGLGIVADAVGWGPDSASPASSTGSIHTDGPVLREVEFLVDAWLSAVSSREAASRQARPALRRRLGGTPSDAHPMTLTEKILAYHAFSLPSAKGVKPGDVVRVSLDWVIASEVAWLGMLHSMRSIGQQMQAWRNDRFWLTGDHAVDPRNYHLEKSQMLRREMETAKRGLKMTENQGSNYTILHTEFVRERAEPGMLVIGADSHTCSGGAVSSLSIGLGAGDNMIGLATGQTWFKVPESIRVNFTGKPAWHIKGKDVILSILRALRRNTFAADRVVEFGGPGAEYLSCDARFAICNMCTELGAITGIFVPDKVTRAFLDGRKSKVYKSNSVYFAPDEDAEYAAAFDIDLGRVEPSIAIYPSPDDVYPVTERLGMRFDGCFIGACTTTEEDLVLAALVLEVGMKRGLAIVPGKRLVVPGSRPIARNLRMLGLMDIYESAGFEQPAPGCSMCLGMGVDIAEEGSNWLSSQNRNFKNRMGKGSVGHICSAATVAAASFSMTLSDPTELLREVDESRYNELLEQCKAWRNRKHAAVPQKKHANGDIPEEDVEYVEPALTAATVQKGEAKLSQRGTTAPETTGGQLDGANAIQGRVFTMGDFVDTDAIIPAPFCSSPTDEALGSHCFEYVCPDFRDHVRQGYTVVVGGKAFGCGSSREEAARALKGIGVKCVIARSFSFIFGRNMPTIGLIGFVITDDEFYRLAGHGAEIEIDVQGRCVRVGGREFGFRLDDMELKLVENRGLAEAFRRHRKDVYDALCSGRGTSAEVPSPASLADVSMQRRKPEGLAW